MGLQLDHTDPFPLHPVHHDSHALSLAHRTAQQLGSGQADYGASRVVLLGLADPNTLVLLLLGGCDVEDVVHIGHQYAADLYAAGLKGWGNGEEKEEYDDKELA